MIPSDGVRDAEVDTWGSYATSRAYGLTRDAGLCQSTREWSRRSASCSPPTLSRHNVLRTLGLRDQGVGSKRGHDPEELR